MLKLGLAGAPGKPMALDGGATQRLAARIQHPNVVATVDVVALQEELFLVMDYIPGSARELVPENGRLVGMSNSFGFGGHNAVLVMAA